MFLFPDPPWGDGPSLAISSPSASWGDFRVEMAVGAVGGRAVLQAGEPEGSPEFSSGFHVASGRS